MKTKNILQIAILLFLSFMIKAQTNGTIDYSLNPINLGVLTSSPGIVHVIQADGKIILAGSNLVTYNGVTVNNIVRIFPNGNIDPSFVTGTGFLNAVGSVSSVSDVKLQADGKILLCGNFSRYNGVDRRHMIRLNTTGALDATFNAGTAGYLPPASGGGSHPNLMHVLPSGEILVSGMFWTWNGVACPRIVKLSSTGTMNTAFNTNIGTGPNGSIASIKPTQDNQIMLCGQFLLCKGAATKGLVKINQNGTPIQNFNTTAYDIYFLSAPGTTEYRSLYDCYVESTGKVVICGSFRAGTQIKGVMRLTSTGVADATFNYGDANCVSASKIVLQPTTNKYIIGGLNYSPVIAGQKIITRINNDGSLDPTFTLDPNINITSTTGFYNVFRMNFDISNKLVVSGIDFGATYANGVRKCIVRLGNTNPIVPIVAAYDVVSANVGAAPTPLGNIRSNDLYNGGPANATNTIISSYVSSSPGITLNTTTGAITIASTVVSGSYTIDYQICDLINQAVCSSAQVTICVLPNLVAYNDAFLVDCQGGPKSLKNVNLANPTNPDSYDGAPLISQFGITYSQIAGSLSPVPASGTISISSNGLVAVTGGVPPGVYTLRYKINYNAAPCTISSNEATVTITVTSQVTAAVDDFGTAVSGVASTPVANVIANDIYAGSAILSLVSTSNPGITLNNGTGQVNVSAAVPAGNHTLVYRICNDFCTQNCATATVFITVGTPNLNMGERANGTINLIGLQSTNKIIIGGGFSTYNLISATGIARLNTDLTLDPSFFRTGPVGGILYDFAVLPNDKILVVGSFNSFNGSTSGRGIALLNPDGTPDNTFNTSGIAIGNTDQIRSCAVQADGRILIGGGWITSYNGTTVKNMIRLFSDGSLDNSFNIPFINISTIGFNSAAIFEIVVQADNSILVGGNLSPTIGGQKNIFRLLPNGSLDPSFTVGDVGTIPVGSCGSCQSPISEIKVQPDNRILVVGAFNNYNGASRKNIVRLETNGNLDPTFMVGSTSSDKAIKSVEIEPGTNNIYIGGEFTTFNGTSVNRLARLTATGTLDGTFGTGTGVGVFFPLSPEVYVLKRQAIDGKIILGGLFTTYNTLAAGYITRINPAIAGSQQKRYPNFTTTENATELKVYPNPSNGVFTIDLTDDSYSKITIINSLGIVVQEYDFNGKSIQVDLSKYPNGQYIARLSSDDNTNIIKLMKE